MEQTGQLRSTPLVILLPTLNEVEGVRATIGDLPLPELRSLGFDPMVLVIDGHSTDETRSVASALGATVIVQNGKGKGTAVRQGMGWAVLHSVPYVIVMDADFTYTGAVLTEFVTLLDAGTELVIGVRRPDRHVKSELRGLVHRLGNGSLNFLAGYLTKGPILDVCSGLWGIRTSVLQRMPLESEGFDIEAETFVRAFRMGLSVSQVPVDYRERVGVAKLHAFRDGSRIFLSILRYSASPRSAPRSSDGSNPGAPGLLPGPTLRDLQSVLFALQSREVLVSSTTPNSAATVDLIRRLRLASPDLRVFTVNGKPESANDPPTPSAPASGEVPVWSMVIRLPADPSQRAGPTCTLRIPEGRHLLYLDMDDAESTPEPTQDQHPYAQSRAYRLERSSDRPFSSLRRLSSSIAEFPGQREAALIAANVSNSKYVVLRERGAPSATDARLPQSSLSNPQ
ncbi:MAG: glycosyltransferase family 2 protein [Thermoplasmata archaeon]|jgi:dolichol-phosphate mannosyltransferase